MTSYQQTDGGHTLEHAHAVSHDASTADGSPRSDSNSNALLRRALLDVMLRWIVNSVLVTIALCVLILLLMQSRGAIMNTQHDARPAHSTAAQHLHPQPQPRLSSEPSIGSNLESPNAAARANSKIAGPVATKMKPRLPRHAPRAPAAATSALFSPDYPESPATPQNPASHREGVRAASEDGKYMWLFFLVILLTICACGQAIAMLVNYCSRRQSYGPRPRAVRMRTPSPPPGELLTMESQPLQEPSVARSEGQSEEEFHASVMAAGEQHAEPATDPIATSGR